MEPQQKQKGGPTFSAVQALLAEVTVDRIAPESELNYDSVLDNHAQDQPTSSAPVSKPVSKVVAPKASKTSGHNDETKKGCTKANGGPKLKKTTAYLLWAAENREQAKKEHPDKKFAVWLCW